ncbi:imm11 family protein [Shewanella algae]|uniref:imm11 family protein n=1 Tax=Shewanella algae TaxID=38313 RepID=UPI003999D044
MRQYEEQYYILKRVEFREIFLSLRATENTGARNHTYEKLDYGDGPVLFENGYKGEIPFHLTNAQMDSIYPVVSEDVASAVKGYHTEGFQLFPAVIIDDDDHWHEDFYFFNFYRDIDCVDFQKSTVRNYSPAKKNNTVLQYKLDASVLDAIPEENRLMIKLAGVTGGALLFHEKIVKALTKFNIEAFHFFKLSDYRKGMEFE